MSPAAAAAVVVDDAKPPFFCCSPTERDVNRTDRNNTFFSGNDNPGLTLLHDVLMTYCMYNFDLGGCFRIDLTAFHLLRRQIYLQFNQKILKVSFKDQTLARLLHHLDSFPIQSLGCRSVTVVWIYRSIEVYGQLNGCKTTPNHHSSTTVFDRLRYYLAL